MLVLPVEVDTDGLPLEEKSINIIITACDNLTFLWEFSNDVFF